LSGENRSVYDVGVKHRDTAAPKQYLEFLGALRKVLSVPRAEMQDRLNKDKHRKRASKLASVARASRAKS